MMTGLRSVWAVELLLLLRSRPNRSWTSEALVSELRASQAVVVDNLTRLHMIGVAEEVVGGQWSYAPASALMERLCSELELEYKRKPVTVISVIAEGDKVRGLANAFRFKDPGP